MINPHGGKLINRVLQGLSKDKAVESEEELFEIAVDKRLARDIENIATGAFSPLEGFMVETDLDRVIHSSRLSSGLPWTIPVILDVDEACSNQILIGDTVKITVDDHFLATMLIEDKYRFDRRALALSVYGTTDHQHPGVASTYRSNDVLVGGKINLVEALPSPYEQYRFTPRETREAFEERGWRKVVGFQTRNVPHVGHEYVQKTALTFVDGLFINPVIGRKKVGDFQDNVILDAYRVLIDNYFLKERVLLGILQTEMRYAGPKEAIFHAIVRKNFGCTHFIVGRDHAGVGNFYPPFAAQQIFKEFPDLGIHPLFFPSFFHCRKCGGAANDKTCPHDDSDGLRESFSGTNIRDMLKRGRQPPAEIIRPEVSAVILQSADPFV